MIKRLSILLLVIVFLLFRVGTVCAATFIDTAEFAWAEPSIERFVTLGVLHGMGDGTFAPASNVTRGQVAKILSLAFNIKGTVPASPTFTDVPNSNIYYSYIEKSHPFFIPSSNEFSPDEDATREDIVAAIVRILDYQDSELSNKNILSIFNDSSDISPKLRSIMGIAVEKGIVLGMGDGTLMPKSFVRRAEVVVMLDRVIDKFNSKTNPSDLSAETEDMRLEITSPSKAYTNKITLVGNIHTSYTDGLYVLVNGSKASTKKIDGGLQWSITLNDLKAGDNAFEVIAVDMHKHMISLTGIVIYTSAPSVIIEPLPRTTTSRTITVTANIIDESHKIESVTINDVEVEIPRNRNQIKVSKEIILLSGENSIIVKAKNSAFGATEEILTVYYGNSDKSVLIDITDVAHINVGTTLVKGHLIGNSSEYFHIHANGSEYVVDKNNNFSLTLVNLISGKNVVPISIFDGDCFVNSIDLEIIN